MAKTAFSRSDVAAITGRMSGQFSNAARNASGAALSHTTGNHPSPPSALARVPSSPVAAKVMREIGVSNTKITEAYSLALSRTTISKKPR
jgi:hypothetical protein